MKMMIAMAAGLALSSTAMAQNTGASLTDGDAVFTLAGGAGALPTTSTGGSVSNDFRPAGGAAGTDLAFDTWWYYRIGGGGSVAADTRERRLHSAATRTLNGTNGVEYTYANLTNNGTATVAGLGAAQRYSVTDTGADTARVDSSVTITNNTNEAITIDLFFVNDYDVAGASGDTVDALVNDGSSRMLIQRDLTAAGGPFGAAFVGYGAVGSGNGGFTAINGQLSDTAIDNFVPDLNPGGQATPADYATVLQWRVTIDAGASYTAGASVFGGRNGAAVPAPGSLALLGLGGLVAARRRRA